MTKDKGQIDDELIDNLLKAYQKPEDLIGENGTDLHSSAATASAASGRIS